MEWLQWVHGTKPQEAPPFRPGDEVRVWYRILEQGKERFGQFEGTVIRIRGSGLARSFTIRRVTYGEGVERVFPLDAKIISRVELLRQGKVKRSKLYYLRTLIGKARIASADTSADSEPSAAARPVVTPLPDATSAAGQSEGDLATTHKPLSTPVP